MPKFALTSALAAIVAIAGAGTAVAAPSAPAGFKLTTFASAPSASTVGPDDIAYLDGHVFVAWQNGVGTKGEPNPRTNQTTSTLVEYSHQGAVLHAWNLEGKIDGLGGDEETDRVIATVNEDGNSSLYAIKPHERSSRQVRHFTYDPAPDSGSSGGVLTGGGTDTVVVIDGAIYVSASNPTPADATAVFRVRLDPHRNVARLSPTFADNAAATDAVSGAAVTLGLTDPDSSASVPSTSPRFGGQFVLVSQANQQLVFADGIGSSHPALTLLSLTHGGTSAGVDDIRWAERSHGSLYIVDSAAGRVYKVSGHFSAGQVFASLDTVGTTANTTEVDTLDLSSGALSPFVTGLTVSKGLLWVR
jgi:hypothetical protein